MDFNYTDEQKLLADSVERFVRERYAFDAWRKLSDSDAGFSREHWRQMAELGWLGVALPEDQGGLGGGALETMIIMQGLGKGLVLEPYLTTVVLGGGLLSSAGSAAQRDALLPKLASGELLLAFAHAERGARYNLASVETTATRGDGGFVLNGRKIVVYDAPAADRLIVSARTGGSDDERDGISLFLVDGKAAGLTRRNYRTVDRRRAADVTLENVKLPANALLGPADGALPLIEAAADRAIAALAAEAVGAMLVLNETTNEYLKTRKQFGRPIGDFQVLQHRMADMFMAAEQAKSMALVASLKLDADPKERARAAAAAKVQIGRSAHAVGRGAVQLHGGMGMTDELNVGHYFKRLNVIESLYGNTDHHLRRFAAL